MKEVGQRLAFHLRHMVLTYFLNYDIYFSNNWILIRKEKGQENRLFMRGMFSFKII
jgi:hypothetical protein